MDRFAGGVLRAKNRRGGSLVRLGCGLLCGVLLAAGAVPAKASNNVPDWVKAAAAQSLPKFPETTKAVILLEETTYTVGNDGKAVEHVRKVVKILRPQGREYGEPVVWFDKDSKVTMMHVWSIDPAGHEYSLKDNEIVEYSPPGEGGELYSDDKAKVAAPPGRDPGGLLLTSMRRRTGLIWRRRTGGFKDRCRG